MPPLLSPRADAGAFEITEVGDDARLPEKSKPLPAPTRFSSHMGESIDVFDAEDKRA